MSSFEELLVVVLDGTATESERAEFGRLLDAQPSLVAEYMRQAKMHVLLANAAWVLLASCGCPPVRRRGRCRMRWLASAAAMAVLTAGAVLVLSRVPALVQRVRARGGDAPAPACSGPTASVRLMCAEGASGLNLPCSSPDGKWHPTKSVRLDAGTAVLRLAGGTEVTLLGPAEIELKDDMDVTLKHGRLLTHVPSEASGFTVRVPGFDILDMGTVFGAAVDGESIGMFVFKGSVQVNGAKGSVVGLFEAGEGLYGMTGMMPQKIAADWDEAKKTFASVQGLAALRNPAQAFSVAEKIAAMWTSKHGPKVLSNSRRLPVPGLWKKNANGARLATGTQEASDAEKPVKIPHSADGSDDGVSNATNETGAAVARAPLASPSPVWVQPAIDQIRVWQRPNSRLVDITYLLSGCEAIVTVGIETNGVALPGGLIASLNGDVSGVVQPGNRHIVWDAGADLGVAASALSAVSVKVVAWHIDAPPLYLVVDLARGPSAASYPLYYYVGAAAVPGGITNDLYKTTRLVMRRISPTGAKGFKMGSPDNETGWWMNEDWHDVVLTKAYYIGVYEVTQRQWQQVMGDVYSWPGYFCNNNCRQTRPVERVSYYDIREDCAANADDPAVNWPVNDEVSADSFIGRMRLRTDLAGFDLPTEAQWEYACRAGAEGALNDGTVNLANGKADPHLNVLGRYLANGGVFGGIPEPDCSTAKGTVAVGSYAPNAWGLYDMHGNVWEWCLDWGAVHCGTDRAVDPMGALMGVGRVMKGGAWNNPAMRTRSAARAAAITPEQRNNNFGFRLARTLP
jgi:formylglycine-generating enzyme required for sulfatase activity/ferric-dicitrate binding protein FerR (iron transport regulator)